MSDIAREIHDVIQKWTRRGYILDEVAANIEDDIQGVITRPHATITFGWKCAACGATGTSSHYIGSQSDLEAHYMTVHELPLPDYPGDVTEVNWWDDRTNPEARHDRRHQ